MIIPVEHLNFMFGEICIDLVSMEAPLNVKSQILKNSYNIIELSMNNNQCIKLIKSIVMYYKFLTILRWTWQIYDKCFQ